MVLLVLDKGSEPDRISGQKSPWDIVRTLKKRLDRRRNKGGESRIESLQLCSKSARCLICDLITTDEHVFYQFVELHFYFRLLTSWPTCQSASLFGMVDTMYLFISKFILYNIRLPLLLWTCSGWRQMAIAMLLRRLLWLRRIHVCNLGPQQESFRFGCVVWLFRSWHTSTHAHNGKTTRDNRNTGEVNKVIEKFVGNQ